MDMQARGELPLCGKRGQPGLCPSGSLPAGINKTPHDNEAMGCPFEKAPGRTRTGDPFITSEVLYQLSHGSLLLCFTTKVIIHDVSWNVKSFFEKNQAGTFSYRLYNFRIEQVCYYYNNLGANGG